MHWQPCKNPAASGWNTWPSRWRVHPCRLPTPVPVTVGGAKVFTLPVERYEEL